jgi:hypothetical protein
MSSITDEIEDNSSRFNKIKKGVDELTTVITKTVWKKQENTQRITPAKPKRLIKSC